MVLSLYLYWKLCLFKSRRNSPAEFKELRTHWEMITDIPSLSKFVSRGFFDNETVQIDLPNRLGVVAKIAEDTFGMLCEQIKFYCAI
mmetsp:Transcript_38454/g.46401  ORF Transcript_38454/g.46401 Transcript_38454/m.46401 type:complete len:87 (+) Transcript_38454:154-414(+)